MFLSDMPDTYLLKRIINLSIFRGRRIRYISIFTAEILCFTVISLQSFPQTTQNKKSAEDFGFSVKSKADKKNQKESETQNSEKTDEEVVRVKTNLVISNVLVLNKQHRPVTDLKKEDFIVKEDDNPQTVEMFSTGGGKSLPRSVILIIDLSLSQLPYIQTSAEAAKKLIDKLNPQDKMAIVSDNVRLLVNFTNDKNLLKKNLDLLISQYRQPRIERGLSLQYSALMATLNELIFDEDVRPIILFQTDGDELEFITAKVDQEKAKDKYLNIRGRKFKYFSFEELKEKIEKSRATIYSIIPGFSMIGLSPEEQIKQAQNQYAVSIKLTSQFLGIPMDAGNNISNKRWSSEAQITLRQQLALGEVSDLSGGWADFIQTPDQADELYSRILSDINNRYVVGYYSSNEARDVRRRDVKMEVRGHPEYIILGKKHI